MVYGRPWVAASGGISTTPLHLSTIGIYVKDLKAARSFYTQKLGLRVRVDAPRDGYLELGVTKRGEDAGLTFWQPDPKWGEEEFRHHSKQVGEVTGVGLQTADLAKTAKALAVKGVPLEVTGEGGRLGELKDPSGNTLFVVEPKRTKVRRGGLSSVAFVTVVARDLERSIEFFRKGLGLRPSPVPGEEGNREFRMYRAGPRGTGIAPFTPRREMYEDAADYDGDMAHLGEETSITFSTKGIYRVQDEMLARSVRFKSKAAATSWGAIWAEFLDPDDNSYGLMQYPA